MATTPTLVRIDVDIKKEATALFSRLGLNMSGAVNFFPASVRSPWRTSVCCGNTPVQ